VPLGAPVFLATTLPNSDRPLQRLVVAQDTGGAIRGVVRADYFWGFGDEAEDRAGAEAARHDVGAAAQGDDAAGRQLNFAEFLVAMKKPDPVEGSGFFADGGLLYKDQRSTSTGMVEWVSTF
jgi:hypothetical protein